MIRSRTWLRRLIVTSVLLAGLAAPAIALAANTGDTVTATVHGTVVAKTTDGRDVIDTGSGVVIVADSAIATPTPTPTPTQTPTQTPSPTSTPTSTPTPTPTPVPSPQTTWAPVGAKPLTDTQAAALVTPTLEQRFDNAAANAYRPTQAELDYFRTGVKDSYGRTMVAYNPLNAYVTGGYTGTTDEILQWVAHKWGIPEDWVRAVAANESNWHMSQLGDRTTVPDPSVYPAFSRITGTSDVWQSLGIMQVRWRPNKLHWGTEPLRWQSTAFNADYWGAQVRYYYDGLCSWCSTGYSAGQAWNSIGAWFDPSPWGSSTTYISHVQQKVADKPWLAAGF